MSKCSSPTSPPSKFYSTPTVNNVKKGETLSFHTPLALYPINATTTTSEKKKYQQQACSDTFGRLVDFCNVCGCTIVPTKHTSEYHDLNNLPKFPMKILLKQKSKRSSESIITTATSTNHHLRFCSIECQNREDQCLFQSHSLFYPETDRLVEQVTKEDNERNEHHPLPLDKFFRCLLSSSTGGEKGDVISLLVTTLLYRHWYSSSKGDNRNMTINDNNDDDDFITLWDDLVTNQVHESDLMEQQDVNDQVIECLALLDEAITTTTAISSSCSSLRKEDATEIDHASSKVQSSSSNNTINIYELNQLMKTKSQQFTHVSNTIKNQCLYPIVVSHPLKNYIETKLLTLSDQELNHVLSSSSSSSSSKNKNSDDPPWDFSEFFIDEEKNETSLLQTERIGEINNKKSNEKELTTETLVQNWRKAARLAQAATIPNNDSEDGDEEQTTFCKNHGISQQAISRLTRSYYAFCPELRNLSHSCVPSCMVEGKIIKNTTHDDSAVVVDDEEDALSLGPVRVSLLALQNIEKGESITISKIPDLTGDLEDRARQLRQAMNDKNYVCYCPRCQCERNWKDRSIFKILMTPPCSEEDNNANVKEKEVVISNDKNKQGLTFYWKDLKHIGDLAMQHGKFQRACDLYNLVLKVKPNDGDVLHARCASYLERGHFITAQQMWREANLICPNHDGISLQVDKQRAYLQTNNNLLQDRLGDAIPEGIKIDNDMFDTLLHKKCHITKPGCPIITRHECERAIQWAEDAAATKEGGGGWTTARHYAVPTTDQPIHKLPKLLEWFNGVLSTRLRPLLALQFGEAEVGKDGCDVHIHDAFIVRYDAKGGQKYLPLHHDQSTHSFTIALNPTCDYDGGGTYISSLGTAIRPDVGGALSFRGDKLLHGGDPLVRGRRYIIVAFCYVMRKHEENSSGNNGESKEKKRKQLDDIFQKEKQAKQESQNFSFQFQFLK